MAIPHAKPGTVIDVRPLGACDCQYFDCDACKNGHT